MAGNDQYEATITTRDGRRIRRSFRTLEKLHEHIANIRDALPGVRIERILPGRQELVTDTRDQAWTQAADTALKAVAKAEIDRLNSDQAAWLTARIEEAQQAGEPVGVGTVRGVSVVQALAAVAALPTPQRPFLLDHGATVARLDAEGISTLRFAATVVARFNEHAAPAVQR